MRIQIITPLVDGVRTGNSGAAERWSTVLRELGHQVQISEAYLDVPTDWLIGLHAVKSARAVAECRRRQASARIAVVLTGTDIYPSPSPVALATMGQADYLIGLQPTVGDQVPTGLGEKVHVIVQAAEVISRPDSKLLDPFDVCVVGHLREVKDPMLCASASRMLPEESKIRVLHAGAILDPKYEALVAAERQSNPRYSWLGCLEAAAARRLIADSQALVVTSLSEGAGRVVGSALVNGTPVLSTNTHGVSGLLGEDYAGLFPVGDAAALADRLWHFESDPSFRAQLASACAEHAGLFSAERELAGWRKLLDGG